MNTVNIGAKPKAYGALAVTTSPQKATEIDSNILPGSAYSFKNAGTETVYVGTDDSVTTANGWPVLEGDEFYHRGDVYLVAGAAADLRYLEVKEVI